MTDDELRGLPVLLSVPHAGRILGVGRTAAYQLVRRGDWPTPIVRVGAKIWVPRVPLLELVGVSTVEPQPPPTVPARRTMRPERRKGRDGGDYVQEMLLP
jgi:hypothetical protein